MYYSAGYPIGLKTQAILSAKCGCFNTAAVFTLWTLHPGFWVWIVKSGRTKLYPISRNSQKSNIQVVIFFFFIQVIISPSSEFPKHWVTSPSLSHWCVLELLLDQVNLPERRDRFCRPAPLPQHTASVTLSFLCLLQNFPADLSVLRVPGTPGLADLVAFPTWCPCVVPERSRTHIMAGDFVSFTLVCLPPGAE